MSRRAGTWSLDTALASGDSAAKIARWQGLRNSGSWISMKSVREILKIRNKHNIAKLVEL